MKTLSNSLKKSLTRNISKLLLLLLFWPMSIAANDSYPFKSGVISGEVIDAEDAVQIPYATIALFKADDESLVTGSITRDDGQFFLEKIPEGEYYIEINYLGYNKEVIKDIVVSSDTGNMELGRVNLNRAWESLSEVVVSADRSALEYRLDRRVVNIDRNLQAAGGTVVEALENLPSIQTDAEGNIMLRGSSSFTVLIDGRPTPLSGSEALRQIPTGAVDQIEIITNPSAKYDPDGSAGIINIIMKKEYQNGFNGLVNVSAGTAWKRSGDFAMNYRRDKLNYFVSGRYAERPSNTSAEVFNETVFNDHTRIMHQYNTRLENNDPYAISGGLDYYINDRNVLSFTSEYGYWGFGQEMNSDISEKFNPSGVVILKESFGDMHRGGNYLNGVLNFDHNSPKEFKWSNSLTVSSWDGDHTVIVNETTLDEQGKSELFKDGHWTTLKTDNYEIRFKSDYSKSFNETSNFEAGYQYRLKDETGSFRYYGFVESIDDWLQDVTLNNNMHYVRHIHSLYGTYSGELAGFQYQGGVRAEYTDRSLTADKVYEYNKIDLFPTVHITRPLPNNQQLQTSYSRRINRPESWLLNPAPSYYDSYMVQAGTPGLLPEITNSYELNYIRFITVGFISGEAYYRQNKNSFTQNLKLQEDGRMRASLANIGSSYAYGVELSSNLTLSEYFNAFVSANIYNYTINIDMVPDNVDNNALRSDFVLNANVMPTKSTRFQLTGFYQSPSITHQGRISGVYGVNLAINQEFFNRQLAATLSVRDVFKTMVYSFEAFEHVSSTEFTFNMEQQVIMLSLRYRINNYQSTRQIEEAGPQGGGLF